MPDLEPIVQEFRGDASGLIKAAGEAGAADESFARKSKKTSDSVTKDQKDSEKAFTDFDRLLRSKLKDDETALQGVQREFAATRTKVADLRTELQKSSGPESLGLFQNLKQAESELKKLENIGEEILPGFSKQMSNTGDSGGKSLAKAAESSFMETFSGGLTSPPVIAALVAAAIPAGAAVGAALAAAIGTGGIVAGIVGSAHDPRVTGAFGELGHEALSIFQNATQVFVGPVLAGVHDLENMFAAVGPQLEDTFRAMSVAARPLIDGFGQFIVHMLPGLEKAFTDSLPLVEDLARLLPMVGDALGKMFDEIASGGAGGRIALEALMRTVANLAIDIGAVINGFERFTLVVTEMLHATTGAAAAVADALVTAANLLHFGSGQAKELADSLHGANDRLGALIKSAKDQNDVSGLMNVVNSNLIDSTNQLGDAYHLTADDLENLVKAQDDWINKTQSADDALLAMHQAQSAFDKELKTGAKNWDLNRAAGQANQSLLNTLNQAITHNYEGLLALHPLNAQYVKDELAAVQALYARAKATGAGTENLSGMADEIKLLQQRLDELNHTSVSFNINGILTGAAALDRTHLGKTIAFEHGGVVHAAQGLVSGVLPPRDPGTLVLAGEKGTRGEVLMPLAGISPQRAMSLAQVAGDAYGFDAVPRASRAYAYAAGGGGVQTVVIPVYIGGQHMATVHQALIGPAQRYKARTGTTGLS